MKTLPGWKCRKRLNVGSFHLPWHLAHLSLADHGTGIRAESDAAASAGLEVYHGHTQVVGVVRDMDLEVDAPRVRSAEDVCAEMQPEVRHLVGVLHRGDRTAAERRREGADTLAEAAEAALPVDARLLPAPHRRQVVDRRWNVGTAVGMLAPNRLRLTDPLWHDGVVHLEGSVALNFQAMEGPRPHHPPRPDPLGVEVPQPSAGRIRRTQRRSIETHREDEVRAVVQLGQVVPPHGRRLRRDDVPPDRGDAAPP
mmetsp:Transcript_69836/g.195762  ORF Transcript_69836/g.195762 Transcript_69836/m.195762 type:complete len:254 (+) Transcript_69836:233-994(+)